MGEDTVCYKPFFGLLHTVGEGESTIAVNNTNEIKLKLATRKISRMLGWCNKTCNYSTIFEVVILSRKVCKLKNLI